MSAPSAPSEGDFVNHLSLRERGRKHRTHINDNGYYTIASVPRASFRSGDVLLVLPQLRERGDVMDARAEQRLSQLLEAEKARTCGEVSRRNYSAVHKDRFADVLRLCQSYVPSPSARVLDVGRSELTAYLLRFYKNVHTLGLDPSIDDGGHREMSSIDTVPHITFDLLNSDNVSAWPQCDRFDLIVFSEVIEHLSIAPEYVLAALKELLTAGGFLICTTPNAADIVKRIRLMVGRNPYERLRLYPVNPGHVREYTGQELREIAESIGLYWSEHAYFNWIQSTGENPVRFLLKKLVRTYPSFRPFQACVLTPNRNAAPR